MVTKGKGDLTRALKNEKDVLLEDGKAAAIESKHPEIKFKTKKQHKKGKSIYPTCSKRKLAPSSRTTK